MSLSFCQKDLPPGAVGSHRTLAVVFAVQSIPEVFELQHPGDKTFKGIMHGQPLGLSACGGDVSSTQKYGTRMPWQKKKNIYIYDYIWFVYLFIMVENNMPILRIAVFLRWDDHPQYGEWIDPITHMKHPSSTLTPRRWWVPHFGSTLRHANGHHPRCIGSSGCSVAGKHGDAFVDLTTSDETKMGGKEIKDEITPNEFINQHGLF